jgi:hypothetical protein
VSGRSAPKTYGTVDAARVGWSVPMSARYVVAGANLMNAASGLACTKSESDPNNGQRDT